METARENILTVGCSPSLQESINELEKCPPTSDELKFFHKLSTSSIVSNKDSINAIFNYCIGCLHWIVETKNTTAKRVAREVAYQGMSLLVECGDSVGVGDYHKQINILIYMAEASVMREPEDEEMTEQERLEDNSDRDSSRCKNIFELIWALSCGSKAFRLLEKQFDEDIAERLKKRGVALIGLFKECEWEYDYDSAGKIGLRIKDCDFLQEKVDTWQDTAKVIHELNKIINNE